MDEKEIGKNPALEKLDPEITPMTRPQETDETDQGLTELETKILNLEKRRWRYQGSKEQAIRAQLKIAPIRYYQILNRLIDDPRALATEPLLIQRLAVRREL